MASKTVIRPIPFGFEKCEKRSATIFVKPTAARKLGVQDTVSYLNFQFKYPKRSICISLQKYIILSTNTKRSGNAADNAFRWVGLGIDIEITQPR